jgi:hypothetical protein
MEENQNEFLDALYSGKVNPELGDHMNLFGQFIGEWEFDWYGYEPNQEKQHEKGEWIFSWVMEGRAIQDLWIIPERNRRNKPGLPNGEYGTTLRFFNKKANVWNVVWAGPIKNRFNTFEARQIEEGIIVMEEIGDNEDKMTWIFSEIQKDSFRWKSIITADDDKNWKLVQEMKVKRKQVK